MKVYSRANARANRRTGNCPECGQPLNEIGFCGECEDPFDYIERK